MYLYRFLWQWLYTSVDKLCPKSITQSFLIIFIKALLFWNSLYLSAHWHMIVYRQLSVARLKTNRCSATNNVYKGSTSKSMGPGGGIHSRRVSVIDKLSPGLGRFLCDTRNFDYVPRLCFVWRGSATRRAFITSFAITRYNYSRPISRNFDGPARTVARVQLRLMENQLLLSFHVVREREQTRYNVNFKGATKVSVIDSFRLRFSILVKQPRRFSGIHGCKWPPLFPV